MKRKRKWTKAELEAMDAFVLMQRRLDLLPKFARTPRPKGLSLTNLPKLDEPSGRSTSTSTSTALRLSSKNSSELDIPMGTYKASPRYTGTKMLGVSVLHKSNGIPVFSDEDIKDISKMRR